MGKLNNLTKVTLFLLIIYYIITQSIILLNFGKTTLDEDVFLILQYTTLFLLIPFIIYIVDAIARVRTKDFTALFILNTLLILLLFAPIIKSILLNFQIISL